MKVQLVDLRLSGLLVVSALAAAAAIDAAYAFGHPWVLAAYTLPVLLCARLPVLGIALGVSAVVSVLLGVALATGTLPPSPARIVALLETLLISGFVLYFRAARDALQLSDERVAGILDGSDTGFVRMTRDLVIRDVNGPWLRMVRARQHQDVIGSRLTDWFPPERRRSAEAMLGCCGVQASSARATRSPAPCCPSCCRRWSSSAGSPCSRSSTTRCTG